MRMKKGQVVSNKSNKTIVVKVDTLVTHPIYKKKFTKSKKFHVHNPENHEFEIGDIVEIYETTPISKLKRWTIIRPEVKANK